MRMRIVVVAFIFNVLTEFPQSFFVSHVIQFHVFLALLFCVKKLCSLPIHWISTNKLF